MLYLCLSTENDVLNSRLLTTIVSYVFNAISKMYRELASTITLRYISKLKILETLEVINLNSAC
jgi:hypothetical protein